MTVTADAGVRGPQPESGWSLKRGPLDHDEVEHPILMPCPLAILGCAAVAIEGGLTGPGHPREHLEPGLHDGTGQRIGVVGRHRLEEVTVGIPGAPGFPHREARALSARRGGIRVHSVYVPNGRIPDSDHNRYKLNWRRASRPAQRGGGGGDGLRRHEHRAHRRGRLRPRGLRRSRGSTARRARAVGQATTPRSSSISTTRPMATLARSSCRPPRRPRGAGPSSSPIPLNGGGPRGGRSARGRVR
jgi:hypothetical protein